MSNVSPQQMPQLSPASDVAAGKAVLRSKWLTRSRIKSRATAATRWSQARCGEPSAYVAEAQSKGTALRRRRRAICGSSTLGETTRRQASRSRAGACHSRGKIWCAVSHRRRRWSTLEQRAMRNTSAVASQFSASSGRARKSSSRQPSLVGSARYRLVANPSIEGTCDIWLRQLSPAPHVKR